MIDSVAPATLPRGSRVRKTGGAPGKVQQRRHEPGGGAWGRGAWGPDQPIWRSAGSPARVGTASSGGAGMRSGSWFERLHHTAREGLTAENAEIAVDSAVRRYPNRSESH